MVAKKIDAKNYADISQKVFSHVKVLYYYNLLHVLIVTACWLSTAISFFIE